ncbi:MULTISPECIES: hypothetical protein [Bradyrhizobium]|jgi:hypothetical protein|uniref:Uncharacterized protein n=1 Tax=Bradyrhizobium ottawaense TaxID=931866 RepID=A0ABV4G064_9BRAD|nr:MULTISPECIES: hypothetical protein [Bradyrhizobium]MBR1294327.1 hypothetical protein [Bradyrhizobium ottawaense]MDA9414460.1 hypothetical protein [Bradyrhizobium sp. CCBAU 25360]MDA9451663.1 hypothetical protein [Bradyrhizobium sp. CCBAU 21360]MDA9454608.1 hypothetical protein [Bradyrhizobium sp. CCBAU 21359]MDA9481610.1 hypothetical protein [Bradyrhizobium sp. CCBAU 11445]
MTNVVRFASKSELERQRLIREARAIYDSIFPPDIPAGGCAHDPPDQWAAREAAAEIQPKQR